MNRRDPLVPIETIKELVEQYIRKFARYIDVKTQSPGSPMARSVNLAESQMYLGLYISMRDKEYDPWNMTREQRRELFEALVDYELITGIESAAWERDIRKEEEHG